MNKDSKDSENQLSDTQIDFGMYFVFTPILLWGYAYLVCSEAAIPMTILTLLVGYAIPQHIYRTNHKSQSNDNSNSTSKKDDKP